jgi:hypothetical protein
MRTEEAHMRAAFGQEYEAYLQSHTAALNRSFSAKRAIRNKEYRAVAGLAAAAVILAAKAALS